MEPGVESRMAGEKYPTAEPFLPAKITLRTLTAAAMTCRGCDLYKNATQTVFGEGPARPRILLIGEQPGDQEDRQGKPFVGPAGRMLDEALETAGIHRDEVYVTNAVKHFRWEPRGKRRMHSKPSSRQVAACRPWLEAEIEATRPAVIVCLGATAAQSLLGSAFKVTRMRGKVIEREDGPPILATVHPSSLLRMPDRDERHRAIGRFAEDLKTAAKFAGKGR